MARYRKAYAAVAAAIIATVATVVAGPHAADAVPLTASWLGALAVFLFPNDPPTIAAGADAHTD